MSRALHRPVFALAFASPLLHGCSPGGPAQWSIGPTTALEADHVFGADLNADGTAELGTVRGNTLSIGSFETELPGAFQRATAHSERALVAVGQGRGQQDAPARLLAIDGTSATTVWERDGERDQITDLRSIDGRVWLAAYTDGRTVGGGWLDDGTLKPLVEAHMGQRQAPLPDGSVVVGRVYGPVPKSPGDLRLHPAGGGDPQPLHSLRGVRAMALADLDGDGHLDLVTGDGWHYAYGREADARIVLHHGPDFAEHRVIGWVPESYAALEIVPIGTGLDAALVVQGSQRVVLFARDSLGWGVLDIAPIAEIGSMAVLPSPTGARVAIGGPTAQIVDIVLERR